MDNGVMPFWANPVIAVIAAFGAICLVALVVGLIGRAIRIRRRPTFAAVRYNPLPPADSAIDQIRREIDESEKRYRARLAQEDADRERRRVENQWREDGEIELTKKKT